MKFKKFSIYGLPADGRKESAAVVRNAESRPAQEVHTTTKQPALALLPPVPDMMVEAHAAQAARRPPRGSHRKPYPSHHARESRDYGKRHAHKGYSRER